MEARSAESIPGGGGWLYEPKWDGFRCLAFRKGKEVLLQSKACQPLGRYFPELVEALGARVVETELIGLVPEEAMLGVAREALQLPELSWGRVLER
ncbi:MAG TPA: hypothetical protein VKM72_09085, partial [Thermoanaerobaculia bacterium]|nr:hypothetical protein [Thermoanaerobaculia bacterium]